MKAIRVNLRAFKERIQKVSKKIKETPVFLPLFIVVFLIVAIVTAVRFSFFPLPKFLEKLFKPFSQPPRENVAIPAKPPPIPLAPGEQVYNISGGKKDAPQMTLAVVDPLDVKSRQTQTLTLKARDPKGITEIKATVVTDNERVENKLERIEGDENDGVWKGSWRIKDSFDYNYQIILTAKNSENLESVVTLTFR